MDKKAVEAAGIELNRALKSVTLLGAANNFADVQSHWTAFLASAGRVFTKLEEGSKDTQKSKTWFGTKVHQRRTDPVLRYVWQARNAHEHTLQDLTQHVITEVPPSLADIEKLRRAQDEAGMPVGRGMPIEATATPPDVRLLPVVNRGSRCDPPPTCTTPYQAGTEALAMIGAILAEAERLVT
jgi:hypothetical protein